MTAQESKIASAEARASLILDAIRSKAKNGKNALLVMEREYWGDGFSFDKHHYFWDDEVAAKLKALEYLIEIETHEVRYGWPWNRKVSVITDSIVIRW